MAVGAFGICLLMMMTDQCARDANGNLEDTSEIDFYESASGRTSTKPVITRNPTYLLYEVVPRTHLVTMTGDNPSTLSKPL
ncbi:hypothetical protein C8J57DRAFT_1528112 [Mycena rebaudengoi]|nr:hypothetical protein C8J57DRAFT_1528112 [Mycena rebaudengoi]